MCLFSLSAACFFRLLKLQHVSPNRNVLGRSSTFALVGHRTLQSSSHSTFCYNLINWWHLMKKGPYPFLCSIFEIILKVGWPQLQQWRHWHTQTQPTPTKETYSQLIWQQHFPPPQCQYLQTQNSTKKHFTFFFAIPDIWKLLRNILWTPTRLQNIQSSFISKTTIS